MHDPLSIKNMTNMTAEFKKAHPEEAGADGVIKVCIGGGGGFIGSHIAKRLKEEVRMACCFLHDAGTRMVVSSRLPSLFMV